MAKAPEHLAHLEWLGFVQPVGLVVSVPALLAAQAYVNRNIAPDQARFLACLPDDPGAAPAVHDFPAFARSVLGWEPADLAGGPGADPLPESLEVVLPEYHEALRPTYAVREFGPRDPARPWLLLVRVLPAGADLDDDSAADDGRHWRAGPQAKFERLLRETQVPIGLLVNGTHIRLVYAPRGETSGHATFPVAAMATVAGRPIFAALHLLLEGPRLFGMDAKQRLPAILADSRRYQNTVSTQLAEQVLAALYELVRGFQAADDARHGGLLGGVLARDPNHVYAGLLTVLMRLVFVLFAEDRGLVSADPLYANSYSVTGLFDRLRADAGRYPDTMARRYGAWAQLLTLFRLVYAGGSHGAFRLPARKGYLFDPDRYPFLEGRAGPRGEGDGDAGPRIDVPRVSDGVVYAVLNNLLVLDGERLSYRSLDVQHVGSVYEAMMGFDLHVAAGRSVAVKPAKSHGAPASIDLDALLTVKPADRARWLADRTDQKLAGAAADALKKAATLDDLLAALDKKIAKRVTDRVVPKGAMVLQPSDERRRSGSHYTPRSLTQPVVETTLRPVLARLAAGGPPTPEQILDLKVCDPAMGSGAFLVEACQQLGDELVKAWHAHGRLPADIPPDEDAVLHARRLVAQRCLYGVDKNRMAVDLAKLSLWLATLARGHPFTFLDHALRHGDSLVGLTREQIEDFHWLAVPGRMFGQEHIGDRINEATALRREILAAGDRIPHETKQQKLAVADERLDGVRFFGDLVVAAFFGADNDKKRKAKREEILTQLTAYLTRRDLRIRPTAAAASLREGDRPVYPFHWQIEFPEVFDRDAGGFDAVVGNPPFAGKNTIGAGHRAGYPDWLKTLHAESHGNADLVAHFFRRAFNLLRPAGTFGLIATNTIAQGDTRSTGLRWICTNGGTIYAARRRYKWPGMAAVVVSVVHVSKGTVGGPFNLDGKPVERITAYLFHAGGHDDPTKLASNAGRSFQGYVVVGMGFTFDDNDASGVASPIRLMNDLVAKDKRNAEKIFPYIGGEEFNENPNQKHNRYIINFGNCTEANAREWPDLMKIVEERVWPERFGKVGEKLSADKARRARTWWQYARTADDLQAATGKFATVLACSQTSKYFSFSRIPSGIIYSHKLIVFVDLQGLFPVLQSRLHLEWAEFFGSTMKDDPVYASSDCFEPFPFPEHFETNPALETAGKAYYEFRADLMVRNNEGLTKTYNRFHDPHEPSADIATLRELHAAMDRAVLDAYGGELGKLAVPACEFLLDYEDEADDDDPPAGRQRRKPWRFRWPDAFRDEVLALLLDLNRRRAEAERLAGPGPAKSRGGRKGKGKAAGGALQPPPRQGTLPGLADGPAADPSSGSP